MEIERGLVCPEIGSHELLLDVCIEEVQECHQVEYCGQDSTDDSEDVTAECSEETKDCRYREEDDQYDPDDGIEEGVLVVGDDPSDDNDDDTEDDSTGGEGHDVGDTGCEDESGKCSKFGFGSLGECETDDSTVGLREDCKSSKDHHYGGQDGTDCSDTDSGINDSDDSKNEIDGSKYHNDESKVLGVVKELHIVFTTSMVYKGYLSSYKSPVVNGGLSRMHIYICARCCD